MGSRSGSSDVAIFQRKIVTFRFSGYILFLAVAIRLFFFDSWLSKGSFKPVFNERFLAFIFGIAFIWLAAYLLWKNREKLEAAWHTIFIFAADFFTIWFIGLEIFDYSHHTVSQSGTFSLLIILGLAAATILNLFIWRRKSEIIDNVLTVFNGVALAIISIFIWQSLRGWMGIAYLLLAVFNGILAYYFAKHKAKSDNLGAFTLIISLVFLTLAIPVQFKDGILTPILWSLEMFAGVWLSFVIKTPLMRYFSYIVFIAMAWDLLIVKTINTSDFTPVFNQRFLAFIIGIAASYFSIFILWRQRKNIVEWPFIAPLMAIITNFLTLWLISFEVWDSYIGAIRSAPFGGRESLRSAQNLSLTAIWAVYAVAGLIIGIWRHWRWVRIGSLILLAIPIIKVFVYDVFKLETSYRIVAFVGLGILLLASAYLYQRYRKVIKGVFTE